MAAPLRYLGLHIEHPDAADRLRGETESRVSLSLLVGKSEAIREAPLTEQQLLGLIEDAVRALKVLADKR